MKKRHIILTAILCPIIALILGLYLLLFANQATTPDSIARKVGIKLPAYQITKADDNLDRTASSWSDFYYEIVFDEPLSEAYLQRIEKLNTCTLEGDIYRIDNESPDEWSGRIVLYPEEKRATLEYSFRDALF